jgi:putative PIN family toxin of toxin-antitoxin system
MKIVLDTNVLLTIISQKSINRSVFDSFLNEKYTLCVTTDILAEYAEIIEKHMGTMAAQTLLELLIEQSNVEMVTRYYVWNLIYADPDDNKFVDCAIACNAKYIVSEDKHFNALKSISFPKVEVIGVEQF